MKNDAFFPTGKKWTGSENKGRQDIVDVVIPDGFAEISFEAFAGCKNLRYVYIPKSVEIIGFGAFDGCSSLAIVEGCQGVKSVEKNAFNGTALKEIALPSGVKLGERPGFEYGYCFLTDTLERIEISKGKSGYVYSEDGVLFDTYSERTLAVFPAGRKGSYAIPDAVKRIGGYAFYHSHLEEILIPEGVEKISWHAFDGCVNLKRIVFPSSLRKIESFALANCPCLEEVIFLSSKVEIANEFASASNSLRRIVIPDAANCDPDWLKGAPASVNVETIAGASASKQEFVEALKEHYRTKSDVVIAGLRAGHGNPSNISAEMVKKALQAKNNCPYFALCADILYSLEEYRAAFEYYEWGGIYGFEGDYLNRLLDCAERIEMDLDELNRVCMLLAENSGLGEKEKFHYSYMESDFEENPYDPSHWTVTVTDYQYAFAIVKLAAEQNDELCLRFLKIAPSDYESKIVNGKTNSY